MKKDIDEILANYLNKELLTDKEKETLEKWEKNSIQNKNFTEIIQKLKLQKKTLDKHQKQHIVFKKTEQQVYRLRKKRRFTIRNSFVSGIAILTKFFSF